MQLRAVTSELGCLAVSAIWGIGEVGKAFNEDGTPVDAATQVCLIL